MPIIVKDIIDKLEPTIIKALIKEPHYLFQKRKILIDEEEAH
jgi:hypothetical protein